MTATLDILEPSLPIVDSHHHVRDRPGDSYLFPDLRDDLTRGHNVRATVVIECGDMYRSFGPAPMRPVGETEFLAGVAAMFASGRYGPPLACAAIVGHADLGLGLDAEPILDALVLASGGRLRGIRNPVAWHPDPELRKTRGGPEGVLRDVHFQEGVALLGDRGLALDAWVYHPQLPDVADLARRCPKTTIVINHVGGPLGRGPYAGRVADAYAEWRTCLREIAREPNVVCKIGGLGLPIMGLDLPPHASPIDIAARWRPYVETAIDCFGVRRCMFESNYPSDRHSVSYDNIWNAFKVLTAGGSPADRYQLFAGTAIATYRLESAFAEAGEALPSAGG
jgi:L-fuconolactonase